MRGTTQVLGRRGIVGIVQMILLPNLALNVQPVLRDILPGLHLISLGAIVAIRARQSRGSGTEPDGRAESSENPLAIHGGRLLCCRPVYGTARDRVGHESYGCI